jgi:hypothetical protein
MPEFGDLVDHPIMFTKSEKKSKESNNSKNNYGLGELKKLHNLPPSQKALVPKKLKQRVFKKKSKPKKITIKTNTSTKVCKFFPSIGYTEFKCPDEYGAYSGATFGIRGKNISCNGQELEMKRAKAICTIKNGQLRKIIITSKGSNYTTPPSIKVIGNGRLASAYALVQNGQVYKIVITNSGMGYTSTPTIRIARPTGSVNCNLCCKSIL